MSGDGKENKYHHHYHLTTSSYEVSYFILR